MLIERVKTVDDELVAAFARLLPQLSHAPPLTADELAAIVANAVVLVARDSLTLHVYRIPTGVQARIDDVVVDTAARGRGVGEALSREAISLARVAGAKTLH